MKGELGSALKEKADFVTSANLFNELCDDFKNPPDFLAKKYTEQILSYLKYNGELTGSISKVISDQEKDKLLKELNE